MPGMLKALKTGPIHYTKLESLLIQDIQRQGFKRFGSRTISWAGKRLEQMGLMVKDRGEWRATPAGIDRDLTVAEARDFVEATGKEEMERGRRRPN